MSYKTKDRISTGFLIAGETLFLYWLIQNQNLLINKHLFDEFSFIVFEFVLIIAIIVAILRFIKGGPLKPDPDFTNKIDKLLKKLNKR